MEPNKILPTPPIHTEPAQNVNPALDGFRDEGIDIVQGSGVSEENEFSNGETAEIVTPAEETEPAPVTPVSVPVPPPVTPAPLPTPAPTSAPKPPVEEYNLTRQSAAMIGSLQEIPKSFTKPTAHPFNDPSIKQIRTFKSDAEEAVKYQNVSAVDIAIAEQKKREKETPIEYENSKTSHAGIFIILALLVVIVLGGGWYYWFSSSQAISGIKKAPAIAIKTIIPYTKGSTITIDSESDPLTLIGSKLGQSNAGLGNVFALIPVANSTSTHPIGIETILRNTSAPNRLQRSLNSDYMVGAYTYDVQSPFVILTSTFFQNTFSGMLEWEKNLREDFLPLIQVSHGTETSTGVASEPFEDGLISNIDVRILRNPAGDIILLYAFADKDTLVITTTQNALKFILDRLLTVRTIQ